MSARRLQPQPLTAQAFRAFGEVIEGSGAEELINAGTTRRFSDLARIDVTPEAGRVRVSIYRVTPYSLPLEIRMLERHPLGSQLFMPLRGEPFLIVTAPRGDAFDVTDVQAFVTNGRQGVNYSPGTWHHPVIALRNPSEFLVVDRAGPGGNCDERPIAAGALRLELP